MLLLITTIRRSSTSNHKPSRSVPQTAFLGIDRFDVPTSLVADFWTTIGSFWKWPSNQASVLRHFANAG